MDKEAFLKRLALTAKRERYPHHALFFEAVRWLQGLKEDSDLGGEVGKTFPEMKSLIKKAADPSLIAYIERTEAEGIKIVALGSEDYPPLLAQNLAPPFLLFLRGQAGREWDAEGEDLFSIVGSRNASLPMCEIASSFARAVSDVGGCIVSGLAYGIDAAAHRGALEGDSPFPTIAILGHGLHYLYPRAHSDLAERILERGGILLSHFEPDEPPLPKNFLERNALIAGMSKGTLIVQAGAKSGSLSTARFALDAGRELYVIPGDISDPSFSGSNLLLKEGAFLTTAISDLAELFPSIGKKTQEKPPQESLNETQRRIVEAIKREGTLHLNDILSSLSTCKELHKELLSLELSGAISRLPGNYLRVVLGA